MVNVLFITSGVVNTPADCTGIVATHRQGHIYLSEKIYKANLKKFTINNLPFAGEGGVINYETGLVI